MWSQCIFKCGQAFAFILPQERGLLYFATAPMFLSHGSKGKCIVQFPGGTKVEKDKEENTCVWTMYLLDWIL